MDFGDIDARIVTATSLWVIGAIVTGFALRVWGTQPVNRAFLFGPYLTPDGLRLILRGWPTLFLLGATALAGGFGRFAYWLKGRGSGDELAALTGVIEAIVTTFAAATVLAFVLWTWRQRRGQK